ncbi:30S ribosomal protein S6 [Candidatus Beckwithbacteria bacterium]|nr:30S ribosomal protein S6 [Candidatus Beckwithbacteria bacterium]
MKKYELTFVYQKDLKDVEKNLEKILDSVKAKIVKKEDWGVKKLAYAIKKQTEAKYLYFEIELEADKTKELENKIKLEENLLRYLIIAVK